MTFKTLFLLFFNVSLVIMFRHEKPVAETVWRQRCEKNSIALNDCNWCHCNLNNEYTCTARVCSEVDMFGHFNDAIREIDDVGMEGHGAWRSDNGACEPGVHYRKNELLCVCTENGKWPNPVCRDIFQILHSVEATDLKEPVKNTVCIATKLYLYDCNVCFCPESGKIDSKLCTKRKCKGERVGRKQSKEIVEEVYATCIPNKQYRLGCQKCMCLRNNRLLCDNCTDQKNHKLTGQNTMCYLKKPGVVFKKDCNLCHCDEKGTMYCTARKCLQSHTEISLPKFQYDLVEKNEHQYNCVPKTKYIKDCNTCYCFMWEGVKYFGCSQKPCKQLSDLKHETCVEGTTYEVNCLICHCVVDDDIKQEYCTINDACKFEDKNLLPRALSSMHGYCEPMHIYQQDCNKCRCLADGKTVACTSKICTKRKDKSKDNFLMNFGTELKANVERKPASGEKSLTMEFIPFLREHNLCPKSKMYTIDCNVCFCMETGNVLCTAKEC